MHIAVCDDNLEELVRISSLLEEFIHDLDSSVTYETFNSATELIETMKTKQYDLLILDILMSGITGIDAAKEIRHSNNDIPIVFLTSSREFAVESYRVAANDYILKPARKEEVFPTISKLLAKFTQNDFYIALKTGNGIIKLPISQIEYVEVISRKIQFFLTNGEMRQIYGYLSDYENDLLANPQFYKPHRSYIINLRHVTELNKNGFTTSTGKTVPIARDAFSKAKAAYMDYLLTPDKRRDKA